MRTSTARPCTVCDASNNPFPDHDQSPRITYQAQMGRQAQGIHSTVAKTHRMDTSMLELWYAQRPLVETQMFRILHWDKFRRARTPWLPLPAWAAMARRSRRS